MELVHAGFRKWGASFVEKLIGDFAFALWDPISETVYLGRDPFGTRPLFYRVGPDAAAWSSEIEAVIGNTPTTLDPDETYIVGYLVTSEDWELTPYKDVRSVPPGHLVTIRPNESTVKRWWMPEQMTEVHCCTDSDYEDRFRELLRTSVADRLCTPGVVIAELSGGLDSSSIACMANALIQESSVRALRLETVSYVYDGSLTSDESRFMRIIEQHIGQTTHYLTDQRILAPEPDEIPAWLPSPLVLFPDTFRGLRQIVHNSGAKVLLSGAGGDQLMIHDDLAPPQISDMLHQFQLRKLARELRAWSAEGFRSWPELLLAGAVWPLLPLRIRRFWTPHNWRVPDWMEPSFAARTCCAERIIEHSRTIPLPSYGARRQYSLVFDAVSLVSPCPYRERACVDVTYPYLDRRLVEFLMATPAEQKLRPGERRSLQRRGLRGIVPEKIRLRAGKRGPDESLGRAFQREWKTVQLLVTDAAVCRRGYAKADRLREVVQRVRHGIFDQLQPLARLLSLELWLRVREGGTPATGCELADAHPS